MSQLKWKLSALWGKKESVFGTDPSSNGSAYLFMKAATDLAFTPAQDVVERPGLTNDMTRNPHIMGAKGGTLTFKLEVKGSGTPAASAVAAIAAEADPVLDALFGTVTRGTGSLYVLSGSTPTASPPVVNVTAGQGSQFSKYMLVFIDCGATYGFVPRFVTSISTDAITLDRALPAAPVNGAAFHASTRYTRANTGHASLAFVGTKDTVQYTLLGCKIDSAKVSGVTSRGSAMLDISCSVSDWTKTSKASLPSTALSGITAVKGPIVKASCFAIGGAEEYVHALDLNFAHKFEFVDSTCALGPGQPDSANAGVEMTDAASEGSIKPYYADSHMTDFAAGTERALAFAVPSTTGASSANGWGFYVPKAQFMQPVFENHNGMVAQTMPFKVNDNGTDPELSFCVA